MVRVLGCDPGRDLLYQPFQ
uniref:Uncharacterized protein n=1 Tax=Anguilla anguilla TaxID=7936 RepID=A0A0E9V8Y8_ANGAN